MPIISTPASPADRPSNREVENETQTPAPRDGQPPRPATEPEGAATSTRWPKTQTDPSTGALASKRPSDAGTAPTSD